MTNDAAHPKGSMMVGIGIAALMIGLFAWLRSDISRLGDRLDERMDGLDKRQDDLRQEMQQGFAQRRAETGKLRERMAHLEGLLEGLREAIAGRKDAA